MEEKLNNKTCGECRFYAKETEHCKLKGIGWKFATDTPCSGFTPRKPITNGDKIIAGGMRAIAELGFGNKCARCIYSTYEEDVGFGEAGWTCSRPKDKDCVDGIEAWLNAPAESQLNDAIQNIIKDGVKNAIDIHEAAYAPDMNDGTMAACVKQNENHDTQPDLCVANNTEKEEALKAEIERLKATLNKIETHCESEIEFGSMWSSCAYKMILEIIKATSQESSEGKR